jgi:AcrR family transcriptional regulator
LAAGTARSDLGSDTRTRILQAALRTFAEKGFDGAKTRDIASRADVTLGLLQYHFGSKLNLWKAAVDLAFADLAGGLEGILASDAEDERARLRALIRGHVIFVARSPEWVRIMHDEGKRRGPRMRWLVDRHVKPVYSRLFPLIESAQRSGILPSGIAPVHFVYVLAGAAGVIFHQAEECKRVADIDPADPAVAEAHALAVEQLFLGPHPTRSSP